MKLFKPIFNLFLLSSASFLLMAVISYFFSRESQYDFKLGFPFMFYEQFRMSGNEAANFGWDVEAAMYDYLIFCWLSFLAIVFFSRKTHIAIKYIMGWLLTSGTFFITARRITAWLFPDTNSFFGWLLFVAAGLVVIFLVFFIALRHRRFEG